MGGVQIEYLLGIYFIVVSLSYTGGRVGADAIKLVSGVILVAVAFLGISLVA